MKILAIRIRNLASLEGSTEIDFTQEPLCSAGIFAITGPTGAGKSTILDALCLALYARTPRYIQARETGVEIADVQGSTINQSDVRAILRDGTADGFAEVDFVGIDGQRYCANWSVRRARSRADGSLQQANTTLKNLSTGNDIGGRKTELLSEIARLVGLNYEQFIRSVLLAQGDFTAFLKAEKDQKASLLEKLTGTHIYSELSKRVFERYREEDQQLKVLQHSQEGIVTLTSEELADLKEREVTLFNKLEQLDAHINAIASEIKWHEDLNTYQFQVDEANQVLQEQLTEKKQSVGRETYLRQVEEVQPTRTWMDALQEVTEQLRRRREALEQAQTQQQLLADQAAETEALVAQASDQLAIQMMAQEEAKPLLDQAKKLDIQLQAKETELAAAQQQLQLRKVKWQTSKERLSQQKREAEALMQQVSKLQDWKEKRSNRRSVAENSPLIISKLNDARKQLETIERASVNAAQFETEIKERAVELAQLSERSKGLAEEVSIAACRLETLQKELSAIPFEQLREENRVVGAAAEDFRGAVVQWQQVYQALQTDRILTEKIEETERELADKEAQQAVAAMALQAVIEQRKASAIMLERAALAASENIETLRAGLIEGQPCPVCGSGIHPYTHENPQLNHVLDGLRKAHADIEAIYHVHLTDHSQLAESITLLRQSLKALESDKQRTQYDLQSVKAAWDALTIAPSCTDIAEEEREGWLAEQLNQTKTRQELLARQLEDYQTLLFERDRVQQTWQNLQVRYADTANAVKDVEQAIQVRNERLMHAQLEVAAATAHLEETLASLQPNFPDDLWVTNWKSQPNAFLESIQMFADEWKQTTEALERDRNALEVVRATLTGLEVDEQTTAADVDQAELDLTDKRKAYATLTENRQSIFNGEAVEMLEARFKQHIVEAQNQLNAQKQRQLLLQTEKAQMDATVSETEREIGRLEKRFGDLSGTVEQWLERYKTTHQSTITRAALQELLSHSAEWIAEEREALSTLERAVTRAASVFEERQHQFVQHKKRRFSDQTLEALKLQLEQQLVAKTESLREHNEIGFRLKQDEANKRRLGDLLATIRAKATGVENWAKLNEIIGSADGKKFRQIAQEYTLDVLLSYANVHLEVLSTRYRLQRIPNTLGLQVLDQDMGDEVRTVYSLSGGESFLVSLALALGLASLSANRMSVESLFIDEGFGSLDPNTLNIAMGALERLHNQGRKVGVISHVQEMTERIPVQIKVSKEQSGRSRVEVVS